jgi:hypothetical protein
MVDKTLEGITEDTKIWTPDLDVVLPVNGSDIPNFREWVNWSGWKGYEVGHEAYDFAAYLTQDGKVILGLLKETPIRAIADGIIRQISNGLAGSGVPYACFINIEHGRNGSGLFTRYDHVDPVVEDGQEVKKGDVIATLYKDDGNEEGRLEVELEWLNQAGEKLLTEHTTFIFSGNKGKRVIDRISTLTAGEKEVSFTDNKEGMLGLRVARELEHPSKKPELFTDAAGKVTDIPTMNNEGVTGMYRSSEGIEGNEVWGTRGNWVSLNGKIKEENVSVVILDHPSNPGFPTYWHARGYGLFAANPLGQKALSGGKEELNFKLVPSKSITFKYRIGIYSGKIIGDKQFEISYSDWVKE